MLDKAKQNIQDQEIQCNSESEEGKGVYKPLTLSSYPEGQRFPWVIRGEFPVAQQDLQWSSFLKGVDWDNTCKNKTINQVFIPSKTNLQKWRRSSDIPGKESEGYLLPHYH